MDFTFKCKISLYIYCVYIYIFHENDNEDKVDLKYLIFKSECAPRVNQNWLGFIRCERAKHGSGIGAMLRECQHFIIFFPKNVWFCLLYL